MRFGRFRARAPKPERAPFVSRTSPHPSRMICPVRTDAQDRGGVYGSGYVLLAFLHGDFVVRLHWLTERQLLDAVTIGQFTPGPVLTTATLSDPS